MHAVKTHAAAETDGGRGGIGVAFARLAQKLPHPLRGPERLLHGADHLRQRRDRTADEQRVENELREIAVRHRAALHELSAVPQHQHDRAEDAEDDERHERRAIPRRAENHREITAQPRGVAALLVGFVAEGFDIGDAGERLLHHRRRLRQPVLRGARKVPHLSPENNRREHEHRHRGEHHAREPQRSLRDGHKPDGEIGRAHV